MFLNFENVFFIERRWCGEKFTYNDTEVQLPLGLKADECLLCHMGECVTGW